MKKIQAKFFQTLLLASTLPLITVGFVTLVLLGKMAINDAEQRINSNLKISLNIYQSVCDNLKFVARDQNRRIYSLLADDQIDLLKNEYAKVVARNHLDFFVVTDNAGKVLVSMSNHRFEGADYSRDFFVRKAMRGQTYLSTEVLGEDDLAKLGLTEKARVPGLSPARGLAIKTSMPIVNNNEIIIGTLTAGYLLNNNNEVLINKLTRDSVLSSSIFLGDIRVCSNLNFGGNKSAIGTKLSADLVKQVVEEKNDYIGRSKVVGQTFLAGYTPLYNSQKEVIGGLGIGLPEKSVFALRDELIKLFILAVILSAVLAFLIGLTTGGRIIRSINKLYWGIEAFARGDFSHRLEISSQDEIQELAEFFNRTMVQLKDARKELEACSINVHDLETKVSQSSAQLEAAQKRLLEYERMAAMGRMATALSHELRNVFAEIQASLYNARSKMARSCPKSVVLLENVDASLMHANEVLSNVLRFSYHKKLIFIDVDINYLLENLLSSPAVQSQLRNNKIELNKELSPGLPAIKADGMQLREAVLNLVNNAIQAMPGGGKLGIFTWIESGALFIKIADTGTGMSKEVQANLFTPFCTTKTRGLGLGLCITKTIIEDHRGSIQVFSEPSRGTTFIISLPAAGGK